MTTKEKKLKVTLTGSTYGRSQKSHAQSVRGLGLSRRIRDSVVVLDTPENRGMIRKAAYLLKVEEV